MSSLAANQPTDNCLYMHEHERRPLQRHGHVAADRRPLPFAHVVTATPQYQLAAGRIFRLWDVNSPS
jgi:hypothetical protein